MSRFSRFVSSVGASYVGVAATTAYSLAIVPIGLRYLGADQFGLWMLFTQAAGYLTLIELGVIGSASRILIDHKDHKNDARYSGVIATGSAILVVQGIFMAAACWITAPFIVRAFNIPEVLQDISVRLFIFLGLSTGLATCFKIFSAILYANQRIDVVVLLNSLRLVLSLAIIWPLLAVGCGLDALAWSFFLPVIILSAISWISCYRLGLLPSKVGLSDISRARFRELFKLGMDFFLVNIGTQLLEASQLLIVSRTMGLTAAATWSVSTKLFMLLYQLTAKVENTAVVFFSEMMVRSEQEKLQVSFHKLYQFTGSLAVCGMLGAVAVNPYFVGAWAGTDVLWPSINNWLIAALFILNLLLRCHTDFAMHTKKVGLLRFLYFFESLAFVVAALWAAPRFGFAGILLAALVCALLFRSVYAVSRTAAYFALPRVSVAFQWVAFLVLPTLAMGSVALSAPWLVDPLHASMSRALAAASIAAVAAGAVLCSFGLPATFRQTFHEQVRNYCTNRLAAFRRR
jgi:O-antigen/teichoic acid export membrane protein